MLARRERFSRFEESQGVTILFRFALRERHFRPVKQLDTSSAQALD